MFLFDSCPFRYNLEFRHRAQCELNLFIMAYIYFPEVISVQDGRVVACFSFLHAAEKVLVDPLINSHRGGGV